MGRGRAKAKQTKVARELKYSTHHTDFEALQRELSNQSPSASNGDDAFDEDDYEDDDYRR
jgi:Protein of unknown function (DUF3073)